MRQFFSKNKLLILGLLSAFLYAVNFRLGEFLVQLGILSSAPHPIVSYLIQVTPLSLLYLLALRVIGRAEDDTSQGSLAFILLFALLFRLPLIPQEPVLSSDIYRYLWEGKVQVMGGFNPYVYPVNDERLAHLRDQDIYPHINRKEAPTVYPAGAQILFRGLYWLGIDTAAEFKAVALLADAITIGFLLLILTEVGLSRSGILIYAWNPLILYEFFHSGHLEAFLLPPLIAFVYLSLRNRIVAAGVLLGLATTIKFIPALLLVAIPPGKRLKIALPFFLVLVSAYLPYASAGEKVLGFLPSYFSDPYEIFNPGLLQLALLGIATLFSLPSSSIRFVLFFCLFAVLILIILRHKELRADLIGKCYLVLSAYLFLIYPALHPWYLSAIIPFLCVIPSRAWLYLSLVLPLSYLKYLSPDGAMPPWVSLVQFVPLYVLLVLEYARIQPLSERKQQCYLETQTPFFTTR